MKCILKCILQIATFEENLSFWGFYIKNLDFLYSNIISFCTVRIKSEKIHNGCGRRTLRNRFEMYFIVQRFVVLWRDWQLSNWQNFGSELLLCNKSHQIHGKYEFKIIKESHGEFCLYLGSEIPCNKVWQYITMYVKG